MFHSSHGQQLLMNGCTGPASNSSFWQQAKIHPSNGIHSSSSVGEGNNRPQAEAKMAEKIVSELQYLMTKTAMQLHGRDIGQHSNGCSGSQGGPSGLSNGSSQSNGGLRSGDVKPHQCQQCLKSFSSNHQLVQHIRVHTGEKPYKCSYCDRRFKQLSHVQQHTRLHTGERPYKCHVSDCGRAFIQLSNLQQHLRNHENQLERLKNRPFHCNICGKGFATESSLRTHNGKNCSLQQTAVVGGPHPSCCPLCQKLCISGEALMEHMKFVHKDPNASGVPTKRRNANHPCPVCGKFYVNEGSLRKHLSCHPEMSGQLSSSLRMWPCTVCTAVFTHENGLLSHMDQMRMDPKHQFAAQYVLSRAANERREREALLAAAVNMSHFAMTGMAVSESSTRISTPVSDLKMEHVVRSPGIQSMDYGLSRSQLESGESHRGSTPSENTSPSIGHSRIQENGHRVSLSPRNNRIMDSNSSAYLALRNNPETSIRPINGDVRSSPVIEQSNEEGLRLSANSPLIRSSEEGLFKHNVGFSNGNQSQGCVPSSLSGQSMMMMSHGHQGFPNSVSSSGGYATDFLNRYRLEQTIKHLHGFQDPRSLGLSFTGSVSSNQHSQV